MHRRQAIPPGLRRLASLQDLVVTREQCLGSGLCRSAVSRLVREGSWQRLAPGLYLTAPVPVSWSVWAWGGVLLGGDRARLGGWAAAYLHEVIAAPPDEILVLLPTGAGVPRRPGPWSFRRERPGVRSPRTVGSPPRIGIDDTVLDLCAAGSEEDVVGWVTAAVQSRRTTEKALRRAVERRRYVPRRALLDELLCDVAAGVRSPLELRYLRDVERAHGLPVGSRQLTRRRTEVDVWYGEFGLLVELDGRRGHVGAGRFRDMRRDNMATVDGLATLRYGSRDVVGSPCEVAAQVAGVLVARGWSGVPQRCQRCRRVA